MLRIWSRLLPMGVICLTMFVPGFDATLMQYEVCPKSQELCYNAKNWNRDNCFSPLTHICLNTTLEIFGIICTKNATGLCNENCYSNTTHICENGTLTIICEKGQDRCGSTCFNPSSGHKKCLKNEHGFNVCAKDEKVCGSLGCYNPKHKICFESQNELCEVGKSYPCKCKAGEQLCGSECFVPGKQICIRNRKPCKPGQSLCGDTCYNPSAGDTCHREYNKNGSMETFICVTGTLVCHDHCYNPKTHVCHPYGEWKVSCSKEEKLCKWECFNPKTQQCIANVEYDSWTTCSKGEALCGDKCYNPSNKSIQCIPGNGGYGSEGKSIICSKNESRCGSDCYSSKGPHAKICMPGTYLLCKPHEETCGDEKCFNPKTQKCFQSEMYELPEAYGGGENTEAPLPTTPWYR